ncbi:hypothetical protein U8527_19380 [Kordia algicida OT-1]|uniref:Uncharacterized protein n=1 Tax=Kordia algicida OT-1 TaxID=391587 RepID=A9DJS1_9FLAO|nr:hypothetical protein [Kordia algicida]EDP98170.1 hypothetical protein KAOT1_13172 [Kordia algicida OT-1]
MSHQLEFCKKCVNRSFTSSEGIICGLTRRKPTFIDTCPEFKKDIEEEKKIAGRKAMQEADILGEGNEKPVPVWRTVLSILIFILVIVRLVVRCSD